MEYKVIDDITPRLCRAARAMLGWHQTDLAERAQIAAAAVVYFEGGQRTPRRVTRQAIRTAFESAGITFVTDPELGTGLFLSEKPEE